MIEALLSRLERVKPTGPERWLARCPAHEDGTPSLAIRALNDGRILAHCFAGCPIESVVAAVGMSLSDLMPERGPVLDYYPHSKHSPSDVLRAMAFNAMVVAICAADVAKGRQLEESEKDKLFAIAAEFQEAIEYATR